MIISQLEILCLYYMKKIQQPNKRRYKTLQSVHKKSIFQETHLGINKFRDVKVLNLEHGKTMELNHRNTYDHQIRKKSNSIFLQKNIKNRNSFYQEEPKMPYIKMHLKNNKEDSSIQQQLKLNRLRVNHIKSEVEWVRQKQFEEFIDKSQKYQALLDINKIRKKNKLNSKIGAIIIKNKQDEEQIETKYEGRLKDIDNKGWKPEPRVGHASILHKDYIYLIGGHCSFPFSVINVYSVFADSWIKQIPTNFARSYFSSVIYRDRMAILFGGMGKYNESSKCRECFNTLALLDLDRHSFKNLSIKNENIIEARRCHSAILFGSNMLVFGGINSSKDYLSDFFYLDLKQQKWYFRELSIQGEYLKEFLRYGIADHVAFSTFKEMKSYSLYRTDYEQKEGIFYFGGRNQKQKENILLKLSFQNFTPVIRVASFSGTPPPSASPLLERYNSETLLIISGQIQNRTITLYEIETRTFINVELPHKAILPGGIRSSISKHLNEYFIFFGLSQKGYKGSITQLSIAEHRINKQKSKKKKLELFKSQILSQSEGSDDFYEGID